MLLYLRILGDGMVMVDTDIERRWISVMVIGEIVEEVVVDKYLKFTDYPSHNVLSILQALSHLILKTTL